MWFYFTPSVVFGEEALSWLGQLEGEKAFIVTDPILTRLGYAKRVVELLDEAGIESAVFSQIEPDPTIATVKACAQEMLHFQPDLVIGLGGGSCMDAAKAAWFLYERPDVELEALNPFEKYNLRQKAKLINIPTTAGTGADVSWGFALANPDTGGKLVSVSHELIPDLSIVDPCLTMGLPSQMTADTGMDVLAHAVEAYTCLYHNDFSDGMSLKATELVFKYLPAAYKNGLDLEAREHMHNAATIAGIAFSNTAIILGHALAHNLGGTFRTHHGRTVGMFLPFTIQFISKEFPERYAEIAYYLHLPYKTESEGAAKLVKEINRLQQEINQPRSIAEMGIDRKEFERALPGLVENTMNGIELTATPRSPTEKDIENLYRYAYEGRSVDF